MERLPTAEERRGNESPLQKYASDRFGLRRLGDRTASHSYWAGTGDLLKDIFLPQGYPESVSDDYLSYQIWDTAQAFCSSITGMLATMAVLKTVGVGDSAATPLAATITWILKDGTGKMGTILFAWLYGSDLDCNAKRWRLVADVLNDFATFLELISSLLHQQFVLPIFCVASVAKGIVGTAGGATRAALVQHQARRDNMADVSAKDSSQETLVNLGALLAGLVLTPAVAGEAGLVWLMFAIFTFLHLLCNYRAVSVVKMETFNKNRLHIVLRGYLATGRVEGPAVANALEPIIRSSSGYLPYKLGVSLRKVLLSRADYEAAVKSHRGGQNFIVKFNSSKNSVFVSFHKDCSVGEQLRAAFVVEVLDFLLTQSTDNISASPLLFHFLRRGVQGRRDVEECLQFATSLDFSEFLSAARQAGWVTTHHLLGTDEWRYSWSWTDDRKAL